MPPLHRREVLGAALAAATGWALPAAAAEAWRLSLRPLGSGVGPAERGVVTAALEAFYAVPLAWLDATPLPRSAWYAPRQRHRAERLLAFLSAGPPVVEGRHCVLGVTVRDISTTKEPHADWGVLGLAELGGPAAVVSSFRTRRKAKSRRHALERLGKVAVHELGHAFGLPHCDTEGCLMEDAGGTVASLDAEDALCARCQERLGAAGVPLAAGAPPWRR